MCIRDRLQAVFCTTAEDSRIEPDRSTAAVYDEAIVSYAGLLKSNPQLIS